eukprot:GFUD01086435.1.p1 GENE.GFUD01086435.1~~GFUD01086435.1.p1  ORF type:complete len:196 (+),score=67.70 GFUD01086435.1:79-666(+)
MLRTSKQTGLLSKMTKNMMMMKKFFTSTDSCEEDEYDPTEPSPLLDLMLEPSMMDKILDHLDVWSISRLEECCHLMRDLVVHNKMYRRRVKRIVCARSEEDWIQEDWEDGGDTPEQNSRYYKSKLFGYEYRKSPSSEKLTPSVFQKSSDCPDCMMVEIGEKDSHFGYPCDNCGKYPRKPYVNYHMNDGFAYLYNM